MVQVSWIPQPEPSPSPRPWRRRRRPLGLPGPFAARRRRRGRGLHAAGRHRCGGGAGAGGHLPGPVGSHGAGGRPKSHGWPGVEAMVRIPQFFRKLTDWKVWTMQFEAEKLENGLMTISLGSRNPCFHHGEFLLGEALEIGKGDGLHFGSISDWINCGFLYWTLWAKIQNTFVRLLLFMTGWWFQTWLLFSIIYGIILPID